MYKLTIHADSEYVIEFSSMDVEPDPDALETVHVLTGFRTETLSTLKKVALFRRALNATLQHENKKWELAGCRFEGVPPLTPTSAILHIGVTD